MVLILNKRTRFTWNSVLDSVYSSNYIRYVPCYRLATISIDVGLAMHYAGPKTWNSLPDGSVPFHRNPIRRNANPNPNPNP